MKKLKNTVEKLNNLIKEGKILEAFNKYYDDEVVIQVNGNSPIAGKEQNRKRDEREDEGKGDRRMHDAV